ncbi:hypothetical protein XENORESO_015687 [Xenotaenia resolanae]|uniref:Uncharacterized protein n=1 Tax=Xenotaenia resolanae TaxID=208358 RepID=A0ABV0WFP8_9TELE
MFVVQTFPITQLSFSPLSAASASEWELSPGEEKNIRTVCLSIVPACRGSQSASKCQLGTIASIRLVHPRHIPFLARHPNQWLYILVPAVVALKAFWIFFFPAAAYNDSSF